MGRASAFREHFPIVELGELGVSLDAVLPREVLDRDVPLALSRSVAARCDRRFDLIPQSSGGRVFLLREHVELNLTRLQRVRLRFQPRGVPILWVLERDAHRQGSATVTISALEVHDRFGGAAIEEVQEKSSCYVVDREAAQESAAADKPTT